MTEHEFGTWYPIEELKDMGKEVLFYNHRGVSVGFAHSDGDFWCDNGAYEFGFEPTHFMPLPPPPGESDEGNRD